MTDPTASEAYIGDVARNRALADLAHIERLDEMLGDPMHFDHTERDTAAINYAVGKMMAQDHELRLLRGLVVTLSDALTDEGPDWIGDGLDRVRRRVACLLPAREVPDWLKPYRPVETAPTVNPK